MQKGYAVDFLSISLHAISRDPEAYPSPCIYAQVCAFVRVSVCYLRLYEKLYVDVVDISSFEFDHVCLFYSSTVVIVGLILRLAPIVSLKVRVC